MTFDEARFYDEVRSALRHGLDENGRVRALNEAETRAHLIDPLLVALGYQTLDEIRREYRLSASRQIVDYMLLAGEQRVVVEAKPSRDELTARDGSQLVGYCATEGIRWALLSNGLQWDVFDVEATGDWEARRVAQLDLARSLLDDTVAQTAEPLSLFARDHLVEGDTTLQAWALEKRARDVLDELVRDPHSPVISTILVELGRRSIQLEAEDVVSLLRHGTAESPRGAAPSAVGAVGQRTLPAGASRAPSSAPDGARHYVFPAADTEEAPAREHLELWLSRGYWGVRKSSAHRRRLSAGDRCCFYASKVGVVARARISGPADAVVRADEWPVATPYDPDVYRVPLTDIEWLPVPVEIDPELRRQLDAFADKEPTRPWSWLIQNTNLITEHDFLVLGGLKVEE